MNVEEFKELEPLYAQMQEFALAEPTISISRLQRKFMIGYNRAARMLEQLVEVGVLRRNNMTGAFSRPVSAAVEQK